MQIRKTLTYSNIVSSLALFLALGGSAYALTLPRNSVGAAQIRTKAVGPSELRTGAVRSRDVRDRSLALQDISLRARKSLRGRAGAVGPPGPAGPPGPTYAAAVKATGELQRGSAIESVPRGTNEYIIGFRRNTDSCVSTATLATVEGTNPPAGRITVAAESGRVVVRTFDAAGSGQRLPFHLIVAC